MVGIMRGPQSGAVLQTFSLAMIMISYSETDVTSGARVDLPMSGALDACLARTVKQNVVDLKNCLHAVK